MNGVTEIFLSRDEVERWNALPEYLIGYSLYGFIDRIEFSLAHIRPVYIHMQEDQDTKERTGITVITLSNEHLAEWYELDEDVIGSSLFEFIGDITTQLDMGGIVKVWPDDNYFTE